MKKVNLTILFLALSLFGLTAQEQFFRNKGGFSMFYGGSVSDGTTANSVGMGLVLQPGITLSLASAQLDDETKPMFSLGYLSAHKEENNFTRGGASLSYTSSRLVTIWGFGMSASKLFRAQSGTPTSLDLGVNILNFSFKDQEYLLITPPDELIPAISVSVSQAFFSKSIATPVFSIGVSHELSHSTTMFLFSLGLNLNFDGNQL
nr:hypothetical protein [uncultured Carboxylicivirga sp.]